MGDHAAFLPQNGKTHTKRRIQHVLRMFSRGGARLGGLAGSKTILAERLAFVLNKVIEAGQQPHDAAGTETKCEHDEVFTDDRQPACKQLLLPVARSLGAVPDDALVSAAQAESALGHLETTEFDDIELETPDKDVRAEEEALLGRVVNPPGLDYSCLCLPGDAAVACASPWQHVGAFGWHPPLLPRSLLRADFDVDGVNIQKKLSDALGQLRSSFASKAGDAIARAELQSRVASLDPTQYEVYKIVEEWADARLKWRQAQAWDPPPQCCGFSSSGQPGRAKHTRRKRLCAVCGKFWADTLRSPPWHTQELQRQTSAMEPRQLIPSSV